MAINNATVLESDLADATCQLCNRLYTNPLLLPCLHSFCKKCLVKFKEKQEVSDATITCPSCDEAATVPSNGVLAFPQNLWLAHHVEEERCREKLSSKEDIPCERCVPEQANSSAAVVFCCECCEFLCTTCKKDHQRWRKTVRHELMEVGEKKKTTTNKTPRIPRKEQHCSQHVDEKLKFYCETCEEITCRDCLILSHKDHPYGYYDKVAEKGRGDLQTSLEGCGEVIAALDDDIGNSEKTIQRIKSRKKAVDKEINDVFDILQKAVEERRRALLSQSEEVSVGKVSTINIQTEGFVRLKDQTAYGCKFANNALSTHQANELLSTKKAIEGQLERCKSNFSKLPRHLLENEFMQMSLEYSPVVESIMKFGALLVVDPALCVIEAGAAVPLATVGKERKFKLALKDTSGADVVGVVAVQVILIVVDNGRRIPIAFSTAEDDPSRLTLTFTPDTTGEHELSVMVTGTRVNFSPYRLWVRQERDLPNISTSAQQHFDVGNTVYGVAVHHNGEVYSANYSNHYVQPFEKNGSRKTKIGTSGSGDGQFNSPWGIAIVPGDILYVCDQSNHRVQKFTTTNQHLGKFGSNGSGDGQFSYPRGITYDGRGHILVADESNYRIQIFQLDGTHVRSISCDGSYVYGVAVDNDGNIHVPLYSKNIVQIYSFDGKPLDNYSNTSGHFYNPSGIFVDDNGYRYITTRHSSHYYLHILDSEAKQVKLISINNPHGVTLDTEGYIYVAEANSSRVSKY